jgi:peroxiredoxin family protein
MKVFFVLLTIAAIAASQTPLTNEEKLALENAQLRAAIAERDKADAQKQAQAVFEAACKRAGIDLAACQYDAKAQAVVKAEAKK